MARRLLRNLDLPLLVSGLALVGVGLLLVYSASQVPSMPWKAALFQRQLLWLGAGAAAAVFAAIIPMRVWEELSHVLFALAVLLLLFVLFAGVERDGARRWIALGGFQFQPSELAKLASVLFIARLLARPRLDVRRLRTLLGVAAAAGLPFLLILREPDLGTSLSLPAALLPMLYWAGLPLGVIFLLVSPIVSVILSFNLWVWLLFFGLVAWRLMAGRARRHLVVALLAVNMAAGAATPIVWNSLKPYQQARILTFLNPERDPARSGYQVIQSKIAIGSGGWAGKGAFQGTQKGLAFLPAQHTDFIFAVLGEEFGFLGCATVLGIFTLFLRRSLGLAAKARSRYASLVAVGISGMLMFHVAVNVLMTVGLAPVTGLPLPFLSYGGTFLLMTLTQFGLLLNVSMRRNEV